MIEVYERLFVGSQDDYEFSVKGHVGWAVVHACKEPYHRQALGYTGRAAPKSHPEYLIARRGNRLVLNLIDADSPTYIPKQIIDTALDFIHEHLGLAQKVLVHCNQGRSRAPAISLLYLARYTDRLPRSSFVEAENAFRTIYPPYSPAGGMHGYMMQHWQQYSDL